MTNIIQRIEIDAGHRLLKHEGKCRNLHGHRYVFEVELTAPRLDHVGRVLDFSEVKRVLGGWLDENWDHGYLHELEDPIGKLAAAEGLKSYVLPFPPTAENMSEYFYGVASSLLSGFPVTVVGVTVHETPNCRAVHRGE